jgi:glycerol-3-phosphate acyltransferase PlsY
MEIFYSLFYILISYLLGSFPSGFIITKLSTGKNILEIGWKKTSGSNVFKNVGLWQGILTGLLDIGKGFLPVYLAQKLGFSTSIQILSGLAAVTGHNWSIFLKFAGGRGIGTFIGAFFALSPKILGLSLIPFLILALIWNGSTGTILFLFTAIFLSVYFNQFSLIGVFTLLALPVIFIKRLSPIKEIKEAENKTPLLKNRLIYDDDVPPPEWRIERILRKLTKK